MGIRHSPAVGRATGAKVRAPLPLWERGWGEGRKSCGTRPPLQRSPSLREGSGGGRSHGERQCSRVRNPIALGLGARQGRRSFPLRLPASASRFGFPLRLLRAGARALPRGPWGAAGVRGSARRGGRREAADVRDSAGMHCPRTPTDSREPLVQGCTKGADEQAFLWPTFLWPHKERWVGQPAGLTESSCSSLEATRERDGDARPRRGRSSWWARAHPMAIVGCGSPKG